ncbi:MAG TPA: YfiR family protein [Candidatus Limnocylindrales bacterium]|nr:YfiR family protein [Candidatus Limnocylindrales bacterium]
MPLLSPPARRRLLRGLVPALALLGLCATSSASVANALEVKRTPEYDLKAVFLYQFAHFVEWPARAFADAHSPITIGVLGEDPFGGGLDEIVTNEAVGGRKLVVRRYRTVDEIDTCHVLFICPSEASRMAAILTRLKGRNLLTVGDTKDFVAQNGIVGFTLARNRLKLRINLAAADTAKLIISSKLLRQAEIVHPKGSQG